MRIHALILCLLCCVTSAFAKDVITKTDGTKLDVKVDEITETVIKYRKASNLNGPVYTIPISSVAIVLYENGDIDTFNSIPSISMDPTNTLNVVSDEDLVRLSNDDSKQTISDVQLLEMSGYSGALFENSQRFRRLGWIIGGTIAGIGVITGTVIGLVEYDSVYLIPIIGGASVLAGGMVCLGFQIKANSLMKEARQMQSFSCTLVEHEILQIGENSLTAGINVMGNRIVNSHSLGVSLGFSF